MPVPPPSIRRTVEITGVMTQLQVQKYFSTTAAAAEQEFYLLPAAEVDVFSPSLLPQVWLLLHGGGTRPSRHLQRHPHHLPAQTGRTLFPGLCQHVTSQGVAAPVKMDGSPGREGLWDASEAGLWIRSNCGDIGHL